MNSQDLIHKLLEEKFKSKIRFRKWTLNCFSFYDKDMYCIYKNGVMIKKQREEVIGVSRNVGNSIGLIKLNNINENMIVKISPDKKTLYTITEIGYRDMSMGFELFKIILKFTDVD